MASSKKRGNHNGRCSVVSEGNKSTGKINECSRHTGQRQLYEYRRSRRSRPTTEIRCHQHSKITNKHCQQQVSQGGKYSVLKRESSLISSTLHLNWLLYEHKRSGQFMHVSAFCPSRATYAPLNHYKLPLRFTVRKDSLFFILNPLRTLKVTYRTDMPFFFLHICSNIMKLT